MGTFLAVRSGVLTASVYASLLSILGWSTLAAVGGLLLVALSNTGAMRRLGQDPRPAAWPRVSVLVPARNEEANIGPCVRSLLAQEYPDFEVLALDDGSEDGTGRILAELAARDRRLRVLKGAPLPPDWIGKNWACHQLAQAADGELLLFTDADTRHHPLTLADAVSSMLAQGADLLTALPRQEVGTWTERLVVPTITWAFWFLPLGLAHRSPSPALSITIGQFMLFRRRAYEQIGGYAAIRQDVADDTALGRRIKSHGLRWRLVDGGPRIVCRMYRGFRQVFEGFSKNVFPGFEGRLSPFIVAWILISLLFLEPWAVILARLLGTPLPSLPVMLAALTIGASLSLWGVSHWRFGFPLYLALLYPASILVDVAIAIYSVGLTLTGRSTWKGRRLVRQKVRLW